MQEKDSSQWYNSYSYLSLEKVGESIRVNGQDLDHLGYYDEDVGKYFSYSNWNGEKYWSEYDGDVDFEKTLSQLGDLESIQYFVGETGQSKPFITAFSDSDRSYISMLGTYSSFDTDALSVFAPVLFKRKEFTRDLSAYDINLDSDKTFAEFDMFFEEDGTLIDVQIRIMTDKEKAKANGKNYAITYKLASTVLVEDSE